MENGLNFDTYLASLPMPKKQAQILQDFYHNYKKAALANGVDEKTIRQHFTELVKHVCYEATSPFQFEPFHKAIFEPIDYYSFGIEFMRSLVEDVKLVGQDQLKLMQSKLLNKDNIVLFANHQTEADPQLISVALEKDFPEIAKQMIFVAGERVVTDPLAIPFSKGRNLLCIYSKRYIDIPPEQKLQKQLHNKKTMETMSLLLSQGGQIIYVAPSGGRDRKNDDGLIQIAPFDPQSIEMFLLMAKRAKRPTHFHTLALSTYDLLPPPVSIQTELGEQRLCQKTKIGFYFDEAIDLEKYAHLGDKHMIRQMRADELTKQVETNYQSLI